MIAPELNIDDPSVYRVSTANPITLIGLIWTSVPHWIRRFGQVRPDYVFPQSMVHDLSKIRFTVTQTTILIVIAILLTWMRYILQGICKNHLPRLCVFPRYHNKLPETVWKLIFYSLAWFLSLYVHNIDEVNSFQDPLSMWTGWSDGKPPPAVAAVTVVYTVQAAYYLHSIYATLFMDLWRKDSWLMLIHHFIALTLLGLSYTDGFLLPGALLVFLHDNSDAMLEAAKLCIYLKKRTDGSHHPVWAFFGNLFFVVFVGLWIVFRLYWYPCKLLYGTLYGAVYLGPQDATFFPILGIMLVLIFIMNVYWFNFIARMLIRVAMTGEEPEDNREWDTSVNSGLDKKKLDEIASKKNT